MANPKSKTLTILWQPTFQANGWSAEATYRGRFLQAYSTTDRVEVLRRAEAWGHTAGYTHVKIVEETRSGKVVTDYRPITKPKTKVVPMVVPTDIKLAKVEIEAVQGSTDFVTRISAMGKVLERDGGKSRYEALEKASDYLLKNGYTHVQYVSKSQGWETYDPVVYQLCIPT